MNGMLQVTIWMNMPSFHQDGLFNALSDCEEVELRVVFAGETTQDRLQLGWTEGVRDYSHRILRGRFKLWDAVRIALSERERLHIVNGVWAEPSFAAALCALGLAGSKFAVYSEAPDRRQPQTGIKALMRRSFGRWVAKRASGILTVSHFAEQFYALLGFDSGRVYPFGYFQANNGRPPGTARPRRSVGTEVIFVGQLIHRKRVDLVLEAMQPLFADNPDLVLSVVGIGNEAQALRDRALSLGIADRVNFEGAVGSDLVQSRLALADVLVLPSRWDGWGMVINEAFSVGVPVIVSDCCGAADLVRNGVNGYVFQSGNVADLRKCLSTFLDRETEWPRIRNAAAATGDRISAEAVAPYLIDCLRHMTGNLSERPVPPWIRSSVPGDVA